MKLFKKQKGQGALEYLLLIGGAVLIAVIVIALLVGMGGQSRKTAQDQADSAQSALNIPQPAYISHLVAKYKGCTDDKTKAPVNFSWNPIGSGGSHTIHFKDSSNVDLNFDINVDGSRKSCSPASPCELKSKEVNVDVNVNITSGRSCGDTYYAYIETTKNNQTVTSDYFPFTWKD